MIGYCQRSSSLHVIMTKIWAISGKAYDLPGSAIPCDSKRVSWWLFGNIRRSFYVEDVRKTVYHSDLHFAGGSMLYFRRI